jgi:Ca2+/Na+ antiporter
MEYNFSGKLNLDDFVQYNTHFMLNLFLKGKMLFIMILAIIFYTIYMILSFNEITFYKDILPVFIFCLLFLFIIKRPKYFYKKQFLENKISQEEYFYKINENEISIKSDSFNTILTKENIHKILFDKNTIYIYLSRNQAYLIKSRYFNNLDEFNEVKKILNEYNTKIK